MGVIEKVRLTLRDIEKFSKQFEVGKEYIFKIVHRGNTRKSIGKVIGKYGHFIRVQLGSFTECFNYVDFKTGEINFKEV